MGMAAILVMLPTSFEQILSPDHEIWLICSAAWEQMFKKYKPEWPLTKVKQWPIRLVFNLICSHVLA